jgi:hypothetical protein
LAVFCILESLIAPLDAARVSRQNMKRLAWIVSVVLAAPLNATEFAVPELQLVVVARDESDWSIARQGEPNSTGGFAFSLTRIARAKVFAVTGRKIPKVPEVALRLTATEEKEAAAIGREVSRRMTTVAGYDAWELRLESVSDRETKRAIVQLFQSELFRCCVIAVATNPAGPEVPAWPDEDKELKPLLHGLRPQRLK